MLHHKPLESFLEHRNVEIHQQADSKSAELQVAQELRFMYGHQSFYRLEFHDQFLLDDYVQPVTKLQMDALACTGIGTCRRNKMLACCNSKQRHAS